MDPMLLVGLVAGLALGLAFFAWYFGRGRQMRAAIVSAPIVRVADVKDGETVRVTGKLEHGASTLEAPFSRRPCAHFDALLDERYIDEGKEAWSTVAHETGSVAFFIDDTSGRVKIDTTRFEGIVVRDHHKSKGQLDRDKAIAFLAKHGQTTEIPEDRVLRYREGVLEAGETVTVLGKARLESHEGKKILVLGAPDGGSVRASDDPDLVTSGA